MAKEELSAYCVEVLVAKRKNFKEFEIDDESFVFLKAIEKPAKNGWDAYLLHRSDNVIFRVEHFNHMKTLEINIYPLNHSRFILAQSKEVGLNGT